jgi:hypothetical protein
MQWLIWVFLLGFDSVSRSAALLYFTDVFLFWFR